MAQKGRKSAKGAAKKTSAKKKAPAEKSDDKESLVAGGTEAAGDNGVTSIVPKKPVLPMFYQNPAALNPTRHGNKGLIEGEPNYRFAAETNSIPLNAAEFGLAVKSYPIVFSQTSPALPAVVVGLEENQNLFVDKEGNWLTGTYIPAYIRRYPFVFVTSEEKEKFVLCIDEASDLVIDGGQPFFDKDGKSSKLLETVLNFCSTYQTQHVITQQMGEALAQHDLLVSNRADIQSETGPKLAMTGFRVVDEKKFNALSDETFLEFRKKGWLPAIYLHLVSQSNWTNLVRMWSEANDKKK